MNAGPKSAPELEYEAALTDSPAVNNKFSCSLRTDALQRKLPLVWRSVSRRRLAIGAVSCRSSASTTAPRFYGKRFAVD